MHRRLRHLRHHRLGTKLATKPGTKLETRLATKLVKLMEMGSQNSWLLLHPHRRPG